MNTMNSKPHALAFATLLMSCLLALPQAASAQAAAASTAAASATDWVDAEIRKVDLAGKKLTLKHGDIKHLDMPAMTMVFAIADGAATPEQLAALKPGDKVKVQVVGKDGRTIVTALRR
jgi:Cu/Ag efflux protein CusF